MVKKVLKLPNGFFIAKRYQGHCKDGKRHKYTNAVGIRSNFCYVCGYIRKGD